jgi:hypothetical protein
MESLEKPIKRKKFLKHLTTTLVAAAGAGYFAESALATDVIYSCCPSSCASCSPGVFAYTCTPTNTNLCDTICWGCDPNHGINCWTLTQPGC